MTYHYLPLHSLLRGLLLLLVHPHQALLLPVPLLQGLLLQVVSLGSRWGHLLLVLVRHHQPQVLLPPRMLLHQVRFRLRLRVLSLL